jgi:hypothetical protein
MRADYPRDDRDMTGRNLPGALEDEDRSNSGHLPALVAPSSLIPPSAGRSVECHAGFGANIKRAIGCSRRFYGRHQAGNETSAPSEALRHHRSHLMSPGLATAEDPPLSYIPALRRLRFVNDLYKTLRWFKRKPKIAWHQVEKNRKYSTIIEIPSCQAHPSGLWDESSDWAGLMMIHSSVTCWRSGSRSTLN